MKAIIQSVLFICAALGSSGQCGDRTEADESLIRRIEEQSTDSSLGFSFSQFSAWTIAARMAYWTEVREVWTEFESSAQSGFRLSEGERTSRSSGWFKRVIETFARAGILPAAVAVDQKARTCPVGGWELEMVTDSSGVKWCPTGGKPCGTLGERGFGCGPVYNRVCVARFPVASLTKRCHQEAGTALPSQADFASAQAAMETTLRSCRSGAYHQRLRGNCDRLASRMNFLRAQFGLQVPDKSRATSVTEVRKSIRPQEQGASSTGCFPARSVRTGNNYGGPLDPYLNDAFMLKARGIGVEITGECSSACTFYAAILPRSHVCVTPEAVLGFHEAYDRDGASLGIMDEIYGSKGFSRDVRRLWRRHKYDSPNPLAIKKVRGAELQALFPLCSEAKNRPGCGPGRGGGRTPMATR